MSHEHGPSQLELLPGPVDVAGRRRPLGAQHVRVVVAEGRPIVRDALPLLLAGEGIVVSTTVASADMLESAIALFDPDAVLLSADLPNVDLAELAGRVAASGRRPAVLLYAEQEHESVVARALTAGAAGVITRDRPLVELGHALAAVASGSLWLGDGDRSDGAPTIAILDPAPHTDAGISLSERRVLALLADGLSTDGVAEYLRVSPHTVRAHVRNVLRKLGAQTRAHAVAIAIREGIV